MQQARARELAVQQVPLALLQPEDAQAQQAPEPERAPRVSRQLVDVQARDVQPQVPERARQADVAPPWLPLLLRRVPLQQRTPAPPLPADGASLFPRRPRGSNLSVSSSR